MLTDTQMLQAMHFRSSVALQVTLDQDYNVPDNKSDIEKVIVENGEIPPACFVPVPGYTDTEYKDDAGQNDFKRQSVLENGLFKRSPELYTGSYGR